jgi:DNA processing protein
MEDLIYYAALSCNDAVGPARFQKIRDSFGGLKPFFELSVDEQMDFLRVTNPKSVRYFETMLQAGEKILTVCRNKSIQMVTIEDPAYPPRLRLIPDPPFMIYIIGRLNYSQKMVAVVGTREVTPDAIQINQYFSRELVNYNIGVVSGLAKGHDMIAQKSVLECDGYTIGVLGCAIDRVYPAEARALYDEVKIKGAVVSEYPPGASYLSGNFPLRNRIISGLADAVLVIQAPEKSGALITAQYALSQNKPLYAVPGNPSDKYYAGTNALIKKGAEIALKPEDIVRDLLGKKAVKPEKEKNSPRLDDEEKRILNHLGDIRYIDDLAGLAGMDLPVLNHRLTLMEIKGLIVQYPGRYYGKA